MSGFVNKQNCRIWSSENPRQIQEREMHPQRVTVWCAFWAEGVIGPFFFEDERGQAVTVNGERYRNMITDFLWPNLENVDLTELWFQQDGVPCHSAAETIGLLHEMFPKRLIARRGDVNWPARSFSL